MEQAKLQDVLSDKEAKEIQKQIDISIKIQDLTLLQLHDLYFILDIGLVGNISSCEVIEELIKRALKKKLSIFY